MSNLKNINTFHGRLNVQSKSSGGDNYVKETNFLEAKSLANNIQLQLRVQYFIKFKVSGIFKI